MSQTALIDLMAPYKGLTLCLGDMEVNVHQVDNGVVFYGKYPTGEDCPVNLYRMPVEDFINSARRSILDGAAVYSRIV